MGKPFEWGASDCAFVFDVIRDMTGEDRFAPLRGYSSEASALKRLRRAGYRSVLEFVENNFVEIVPHLAQRGDIGYPASIASPLMSPAIIDCQMAHTKGLDGTIVVPRSFLVRAWAV